MIKTHQPADAAAVALSFGCLLHCLALPIAASALPILGAAEDAEWVHWAFVALAIPASVVALRRGSGSPRLAWTVRVAATLGAGLLVIGAAGWPDHDWETPLTVAGALVLAGAHIVNVARRHTHHGEPA